MVEIFFFNKRTIRYWRINNNSIIVDIEKQVTIVEQATKLTLNNPLQSVDTHIRTIQSLQQQQQQQQIKNKLEKIMFARE
ncbi:hypothetical protein T4B_14027 [Trichinella pseudospiralis]|uniref:Uncharacterized protein n=1 Tax=Trichinella pseudospiralis TaxID=6337 RepID=A0A0V1JAP0_TRIPS|nr:hypothetical protein T4A_1938 [Trichinella pseudospiralis]KRZ32032.1 hypothetical protein T4B_14027 [Trichinella pseudospiralis]KRZ45993.1 hypothetical protein T4C_4519 [Trichinella pseudospiralis]